LVTLVTHSVREISILTVCFFPGPGMLPLPGSGIAGQLVLGRNRMR
jgi:hypothetical protein